MKPVLPLKKILHIVLADDDENECTLFSQALDNLRVPHICSVVKSCEMLMHILDKQNFYPDFIFLHLNPPQITGKDCLKAIKTKKKLSLIPVILYSGSENTKDRDYCYNIKPYEYFINALFFLL